MPEQQTAVIYKVKYFLKSQAKGQKNPYLRKNQKLKTKNAFY